MIIIAILNSVYVLRCLLSEA